MREPGDCGTDMDPKLWELYEGGDAEDEVSVIVRMAPGAEPPPGLRVVSQFGEIATARINRGEIVAARERAGVLSLKASGLVSQPPPVESMEDEAGESPEVEAEAAPPTLAPAGEDGRGVVVGVCDWGIDFTHANFRNADGTTRLEGLWDQRGAAIPRAPLRTTTGGCWTARPSTRPSRSPIRAPRSAITRPAAIPATPDRMARTWPTSWPAIAASRARRSGSPRERTSCSSTWARSSSRAGRPRRHRGLLEGLDFVRRQAAGRPCVLHLSAGKTGGPHRGNTLLERAVDAMLKQPGIVLVQSVGN